MKKILLSSLIFGNLLAASAQQIQQSNAHNPAKNASAKMQNSMFTGDEILPNLMVSTNPYLYPTGSNKYAWPFTLIGTTKYDLQSNNSVQNRLKMYSDKTIAAVWTMGALPTGYTDRGTGYNYWDGTAWTIPTSNTTRLENLRVGWPSIDYIEQTNKGEYIMTHETAGNHIHNVKRPIKGTGAFTDNDETFMALWPRMKTGGPDGSTVHAIALTVPTSLSGTTYMGLDGALVYFRSLDGGVTWDMSNIILPGMDSTMYNSFSADEYAIDVKGSTVAILVTGKLHDSFVMKSTDNGSTWSKIMVLPFPIANYDVGAAGSITDVNSDGIVDTITTSDGSGAIILDNNNMAHVWFGAMRVLDDDPTADSTAFSYFPGTSGLVYWNENSTGTLPIIADVVDENLNDTIDIASADIASYFLSLTGMPNAGVDAQGNLYVSYSGVSEKKGGTASQNLRRLYVIKSEDGGATWSAPFDPQADIAGGGDEFGEYVFASMEKNVDNMIRLTVQRDYEPGLSVRGDLDPAGDNEILYFELDAVEFNNPVFSVENANAAVNTLKVYPNPASDLVNVSFNMVKTADVSINVSDITGKRILSFSQEFAGNSAYNVPVNISSLAKGIYIVNIIAGNTIQTEKLIVK